MTPEERIEEMGLVLPPPVKLPEGLTLPFAMINVRGNRAVFAGHPRHGADGGIDGPFGRLGEGMTTQEGYEAARGVALSVLGNLKAEIGELSRVSGFVRVFGMVNSTPEFTEQHLVINGFSDLSIDVFGPKVGRHSRSAIGVAGLPMKFAIEIEAEVLLAD